MQFTQFTAVGLSMKNDAIKSKTISIIRDYSASINDIEEEYLFVLLFQGDNKTIPVLQDLLQTWEYRADSIKRHYPSKLTRFFHRFKGLPRYEEIHSICRKNSYKLAWTINKLDSSKMSFERVEAIRKQIARPHEPSEMDWYTGYSYVPRADTILLSNKYRSIDEIDLDQEPTFIKHKEDLEGPKCRTTVITNNSVALYDIGCQWAPLSGRGKTLRLELIEGNKLVVSLIQAWIS